MNKIKYALASTIICLTLIMSAFADGDTGIGSRSDNPPPASVSESSSMTDSFQLVIINLLNLLAK